MKSLRIDVPAEVAAGLRVTTPGVREKADRPAAGRPRQGLTSPGA